MTPTPTKADHAPPTLTIFYDGDCPVCRLTWQKQTTRLQKANIHLRPVTHATAAETAAQYGIPDPRAMLTEIYAVRPDGSLLRGMQVFYEFYRLTGDKWYIRLVSRPPLSLIADLLYKLFARNRLTVARLLRLQ